MATIYRQTGTRTPRLLLRALEYADYAVWFDACIGRLPAQSRWDTGPRKPAQCSRAAFRALIGRYQRAAKADDAYWYGVFERQGGRSSAP